MWPENRTAKQGGSQMRHQEFFDYLMQKGLVYRYSQERFAQLAGGGQPYSSPTKVVKIDGQDFVEELIQPTLKPVVLTLAEIVQLEKIARVFREFLKAQMKLFRKVKQGQVDSSISSLIRQMCTEKEWECGLINPGYSEILPFLRLDCLRTKNGFLVVDINSTRPAGVGDVINLSRAYSEFGIADRPFAMEEYFVEAVKNCFEEWGLAVTGEIVEHQKGDCLDVAVKETDGDWQNFKVLAECLVSAGFKVKITDQLSDDNLSRVIIRSRIKEGNPLFGKLESLYPDECCVLSPLYHRFFGNKLWMYLVYLPQAQKFFRDEMGEGDFEFLKSLFSEVGIMRGGRILLGSGEEIELTTKNRKEWVVKTPSGSSAQGMIFGLMNEQRWQEMMSAVCDGAIAQRFYKAMEKFQIVGKNGEVVEDNFYTKYGIFILGGRFTGCEVMARKHHIVHGARNTYFSCCFKEKIPLEVERAAFMGGVSNSNHPSSCKCWHCIGSASRFATDED